MVRWFPAFAICTICCLAGQAEAQYAPRELFKFAKFKYDQGAYREALDYLDRSLAVDSVYQNALFLKADVLVSLERYDEAVRCLDAGFALGEVALATQAGYDLIRGKSLYQQGRFTEAGDAIDLSLSLNRQLAEAYYYRAQLRNRQASYIEAFQDLVIAISLDPLRPEYHFEQARQLDAYYQPQSNSTLFHRVIESVNTAIELRPGELHYLRFKGDLLIRHRRYAEARETYDEIIKLHPGNPEVYSERAMLRMKVGDYSGAVEDFTASIELGQNDERNFRFRGLCYHNLNEPRAAEVDLSESIALMSQSLSAVKYDDQISNALAETYIMRGSCLQTLGSTIQACRDFLAAQELGLRKGYSYYRKFCDF